jgi:hypothetical protein
MSTPNIFDQLIEHDNERMKIIVKVISDDRFEFAYINKRFIDFHQNLSVRVTEKELMGMNIKDYFQIYLGFTEDQINQRMEVMRKAKNTDSAIPFKEVSDHPGIPVMILESIWKPLVVDDTRYLLWTSKVYTQTKV